MSTTGHKLKKYIIKKRLTSHQKYDNKISHYTNLNGGANIMLTSSEINIDEVIRSFNTENINNYGQQNCGILKYKKYIIKCLKTYINQQESIDIPLIHDDIIAYFPLYYKWPNNHLQYNIPNRENTYSLCIIMERLDGDLTDYIFKSVYKETFGNMESYDNFINELVKMPKSNNQMAPKIIILINELIPKIIILHHELSKRGYVYNDLKLDNIGYKQLNDDVHLYFLDPESGYNIINNTGDSISLFKQIIDYEDKPYKIKSIKDDGTIELKSMGKNENIIIVNKNDIFEYEEPSYNVYMEQLWVTKSLYDYYIFGRNTINDLFHILTPVLQFIEKQNIVDHLIKLNFIKIYENEYYNYITMQYKSRLDFVCIQYISHNTNNCYRLVRFDENNKHPSNDKYNNVLEKIDELFYDLPSLYNKLQYIFNI